MAVDSQLAQYIQNIRTSEQYGFRPKSNTSSTCFDLISRVCQSRDDGKITCLTFIDTQKVFNSVNRNKLMSKLNCLGVRDVELTWFRNFLSDTMQYSECRMMKSNLRQVNSGLIQGSILSPRLFNLFSCDLYLMNFNGKFYSFADDLCFQHSSSEDHLLEQLVNRDMMKFEAYMKTNYLTVNANKTKSMIVGNCDRQVVVKYGRETVDIVLKYLGLNITSDLRWNVHIEKLVKNLSALTGVFWKIRHLIPHCLKMSLYHSMFISYLIYCLPIYGSTTNENIIRLQRIQNKALKNLYTIL